jgi:hypothetical protein
METTESLHERVEVLEHQIEALINRAQVIERRLRWWCALACGLLVLGLFSLPLPSSTAQEQSSYERAMAWRLAALEYKLQYVSGGPNELLSPEQTYASSMAWGAQRLRMAWAT